MKKWGCKNEVSKNIFASPKVSSTILYIMGKHHGHSTTREYRSWYSMMYRCYNSKDIAYANYGGRGVRVCKRWHSFENFLADMGPRPVGLTLDRVHGTKGYSPTNCRWATRAEQNVNRSTTKLGEREVREIRASTEHPKVLAKRYGTSPENIRAVRNRRTWKHLA